MNRLALGAVAAALLCLGVARAAPDTIAVFRTVDAVKCDPSRLWVTGVVDGETDARTVLFTFQTSGTSLIEQLKTCERLALLAMAKPGQYLLTVQQDGTGYYYATCTLARVSP